MEKKPQFFIFLLFEGSTGATKQGCNGPLAGQFHLPALLSCFASLSCELSLLLECNLLSKRNHRFLREGLSVYPGVRVLRSDSSEAGAENLRKGMSVVGTFSLALLASIKGDPLKTNVGASLDGEGRLWTVLPESVLLELGGAGGHSNSPATHRFTEEEIEAKK